MRSWGPKEYRASPQIARVHVASDGVLYALSGNLLLWFDGQEFGRLELPLNHVRAMAFGAEGQVYLGGTDEVGVVRPDAFGKMAYQSLTEDVPPADRQVGVVWEAEVLFWVSEGKTNAEVGVILDSARRTVEKHVEHILEKLGVENRSAAIREALRVRGV